MRIGAFIEAPFRSKTAIYTYTDAAFETIFDAVRVMELSETETKSQSL
jgi:hypothetical protein